MALPEQLGVTGPGRYAEASLSDDPRRLKRQGSSDKQHRQHSMIEISIVSRIRCSQKIAARPRRDLAGHSWKGLGPQTLRRSEDRPG